MTGSWIAVALSVLSAFCYGGGAVVQRRLALHLDSCTRSARTTVLPPILRHRSWWLSVGLNTAGALLHIAALVFGTLIAVQSLGMLALVFALPWSALLAAQRVTPQEWHGAILTVLALGVVLFVTQPSGGDARLGPMPVLLVPAATGTVLGLLAGAARRLHGPWRGLLLAAAAGVAFGGASALTKVLIAQVTAQAGAGLLGLGALGSAALAVAGMLLSQAAYRDMNVGAPLAAMSLANPLSAALIGVLFLGERYAGGSWSLGVSVLAGVLAARGILLLAAPAPRARVRVR